MLLLSVLWVCGIANHSVIVSLPRLFALSRVPIEYDIVYNLFVQENVLHPSQRSLSGCGKDNAHFISSHSGNVICGAVCVS